MLVILYEICTPPISGVSQNKCCFNLYAKHIGCQSKGCQILFCDQVCDTSQLQRCVQSSSSCCHLITGESTCMSSLSQFDRCLSDEKTCESIVTWARQFINFTTMHLCLVSVGANKFYRDQVAPRDQEPWLFRGGLLGEIQVCMDSQAHRCLVVVLKVFFHTSYIVKCRLVFFCQSPNFYLFAKCCKMSFRFDFGLKNVAKVQHISVNCKHQTLV